MVGDLVLGSSGGGGGGLSGWLIVALPMVLQTPSAPSVLHLTPPLGSPCSVRWLAASIHICIGQALVEPLRRQLKKQYQVSVSKHFLASAIVSGFGVCRWDGSLGGAVSGCPFLQSCSTKGNAGTKSRTETEGKAIQRLPHLGTHPICRHQILTLLLLSRGAC